MFRRGIRSFSTASALRSKIEVGTVPPVAAHRPIAEQKSESNGQGKKRRPFRRFLYTTGFLTALFYGAGTYLSLDSDGVYYYFSEYVPGAASLVAIAEDARVRNHVYHYDSATESKPRSSTTIQRAGDPSNRSNSSTYNPNKSSDRAVTSSSKDAKAVATVSDAKIGESKPTSGLAKATESLIPAVVPASTPATAEPVAPTDAALPQLTGSHDLDPALNHVLDGLNRWIVAANKHALSESDLHAMETELRNASAAIVNLRQGAKHEYAEKLAEQERAQEAYRQHLEEKLSEELSRRQQKIVEVANRRARREAESVRDTVVAEANNRLRIQETQLTEAFAKEVSSLVDTERNGRLARLEDLQKQVSELQKQVVDSGSAIAENDKVVKFFTALADVQNKLQSEAQPLLQQFERLKAASQLNSKNNELLDAALAAVPQDALKHGVLSHQQLAARFALIAPQIRRSSLVPENAGVGGHISSVVLSNLLVKKQGLPVGDDIESVLARAETQLSQGQIIEAVAEVNSLRGWPREIAADWLAEARKRAEFEFLVKTLAAEGLVCSR